MVEYSDLQTFFKNLKIKVIMAADAETYVHERKGGQIAVKLPAGGVSIALDPIAKASRATYIARAKTKEDKEVVDRGNKIAVGQNGDNYTLKRLFIPIEEFDSYYNGFANQTLWPLCHVAFEPPQFHKAWFEGYKKVNQRFADAIKQELNGKSFVWIHDYQLALVPKYLNDPKNTTVAMFWHIPWPTWEVFRILPNKKEILESLLHCDFLAFHRGYQARNFLRCIERELEARIDEETNTVYYNNRLTRVGNLPLGVDTDVISSLMEGASNQNIISQLFKGFLRIGASTQKKTYDEFFAKNKVILGIDRLDYTKGLRVRLQAIDRFFEKNPAYRGKLVYFGILAPSREAIPAYKQLKKEIRELAEQINEKYAKNDWQPIRMVYEIFSRKEIINFYQKADVCLVTPLDDGMNLVSKEYVIASQNSEDPGCLILSQFAGSAIDLTSALIVNPYNVDEVVFNIKKGLEMNSKEKRDRIKKMAETLKERNVYVWTEDFVKAALQSTAK